ncbi:hypothetical protein PLUTE_a6013 [Pseudoalteromonas luteoviolacea DSM 6061]|nr:hypothetical protein [Pseudoalteromonas luteoviolacea DSM 6061]
MNNILKLQQLPQSNKPEDNLWSIHSVICRTVT